MNLTDTSSLTRTLSRRPRRLLTDFTIAFFAFNIIACAFLPKSVDAKAHASADNDYGISSAVRVTTHSTGQLGTGLLALVSAPKLAEQGHFSQVFSGSLDTSGRPLPAPTGLLFMSLVFAALTALNLQLVRHLREVYAMPKRGRRRG
jgi:hypothetical protein